MGAGGWAPPPRAPLTLTTGELLFIDISCNVSSYNGRCKSKICLMFNVSVSFWLCVQFSPRYDISYKIMAYICAIPYNRYTEMSYFSSTNQLLTNGHTAHLASWIDLSNFLPWAVFLVTLHAGEAAVQCVVITPVCLWVCYHDNLKLRASILTKLGL